MVVAAHVRRGDARPREPRVQQRPASRPRRTVHEAHAPPREVGGTPHGERIAGRDDEALGPRPQPVAAGPERTERGLQRPAVQPPRPRVPQVNGGGVRFPACHGAQGLPGGQGTHEQPPGPLRHRRREQPQAGVTPRDDEGARGEVGSPRPRDRPATIRAPWPRHPVRRAGERVVRPQRQRQQPLPHAGEPHPRARREVRPLRQRLLRGQLEQRLHRGTERPRQPQRRVDARLHRPRLDPVEGLTRQPRPPRQLARPDPRPLPPRADVGRDRLPRFHRGNVTRGCRGVNAG